MNHLAMSGSKVRPQGRAPRRVTDEKTCTESDCSTRLSSYNRKDTCFRHSPIRVPTLPLPSIAPRPTDPTRPNSTIPSQVLAAGADLGSLPVTWCMGDAASASLVSF